MSQEGSEKDSSAVIKALLSYKEALTKDGNANAAEIEAFLPCLDVEDEENSLVRKIIALDELLVTVRDRLLRRADADFEFYQQESWWQMCKRKFGKACFSS